MSPPGPPPLRPFGLVLHRDGSWTHEGHPITNRRLRALFDRSVRFLPDEQKFVVQVAHFRGEIEVEEAAFFVRSVDLETGDLALSDRTRERLDLETLQLSDHDGGLLCRVKRDLAEEGLLARFTQTAQAELLLAVEDAPEGVSIELGGRRAPFPEL